jgi:hypothetical protein
MFMYNRCHSFRNFNHAIYRGSDRYRYSIRTVHAVGFLVAKYEKLINCTQDKLPVTSLITSTLN